jgi:hypothetical protein
MLSETFKKIFTVFKNCKNSVLKLYLAKKGELGMINLL